MEHGGAGQDSERGFSARVIRPPGRRSPKPMGLVPSARHIHASTAKNQKVHGTEFLILLWFFFLFLFLKKHICAAVSVQRVRTQNKYVIGNSGMFTVSKA